MRRPAKRLCATWALVRQMRADIITGQELTKMADTKTDSQKVWVPATTPEATPALKPAGVTVIPSNRGMIGPAVNPLSKGQRKHLRRQKEAGETKVTLRRSQVSR
jgi:hypothetical protein